jgi:SAM-dependent methyltransferase
MHLSTTPSAWVERFVNLFRPGGNVLDLAAGGGRHSRLFLARGHTVLAVDRDVSNLTPAPGLEILEADLEGGPWPLVGRQFDGVVVTNYLHRPLLPLLVMAVAPGGALIYETFAVGNERFGRPRNSDFLLRPGELLDAVRGQLTVRSYDHGEVPGAVIQRIAAVRD